MGKRSKQRPSDTQLILDVMGLGAVFAMGDLMITSAHTRGESFLLSLDRQRQFGPLDVATLTTSVNDILDSGAPIGGDMPGSGRSELERIIRRQEQLIREQEKIIGEIATGRPAVT